MNHSRIFVILFSICGFFGSGILIQGQVTDIGSIFEIEWNADGTLTANVHGYFDGHIRVRTLSGEIIWQTAYLGRGDISWHPTNPDILAVTGSDDESRIFNVSTNMLVASFGEDSGGNSIAYSMDATKLAVGQGEFSSDSLLGVGEVKIYDLSGTVINIISGFRSGVTKLVWHPDNIQIAVLGGGVIEVWNTINETRSGIVSELREITDNTRTYMSGFYQDFDWYPQNNLLIAVLPSNIVFWDTTTYLQTPIINIMPVVSVDWSPYGNYIATAGDFGIQIVDVVTGITVKHLDTGNHHNAVAWHPSGEILVYDGTGGIQEIMSIPSLHPTPTQSFPLLP